MFKVLFALAVLTVIFGLAVGFNLNNFPVPTGNYGVGKIEQHVVDINRQESNNLEAHRELMIHIWYPTAAKITTPQTLYDGYALAGHKSFIKQQSGLPTWLFAGMNGTKTYAVQNAPVATDHNTFPVIIATHGSGPMIQQYSWFCEELASQGYIVVGVNHPYMAAVTKFPDGRVIKSLMDAKKKESKQIGKVWKQQQFEVAVEDITFVFDQLAELKQEATSAVFTKFDLENIGMCGHSFGGSLTMRMCGQDKRIKAGVAFDCAARADYKLQPFNTPFFEIVAQNSHAWSNAEGKAERAVLDKFCREPGMNMTIITFKNIGHAVFTDLPLLLHQTFFGRLLSHFINVDVGASSADSIKAQGAAKKYFVAFFDKYLKNKPSPLFESARCDEVVNPL